jgi:hypothetical protein
MALYKFAKWQIGFKFNPPAKASSAHGHISPVTDVVLADNIATNLGSSMQNLSMAHQN